MNINRHNYEEFFLLYVDEELSAADRKAVEVFVQANPDLEEELLMLQQSIVQPDTIAFDAKASLLKEESTTPLQEKLLLLADDELPRAEKDAVLKLLSTDAAAAKEWNILQQTKLHPDDAVVFADKSSLYRKEQAEVVTIKWWRVAAAAIFIGLGIWGVVAVYNNNTGKTTGKENMASGNDNKDKQQQQPIAKQPVTNPASGEIKSAKENNADNTQQQVALTAPQKNSTAQKVTDKNKTTVKDNNDEDNTTPKENIAVTNEKELNKKPSNNLPTPLYNNINNEPRNKNTLAAVPHTDEDAGTDPKKGIALAGNGLQDKLKGVDPATNPIAKTAVYNENENVPYINTDNKKRSKLGGFLRKVTRVIARTTNTSEGDGKSVKIAGFDIAIN